MSHGKIKDSVNQILYSYLNNFLSLLIYTVKINKILTAVFSHRITPGVKKNRNSQWESKCAYLKGQRAKIYLWIAIHSLLS